MRRDGAAGGHGLGQRLGGVRFFEQPLALQIAGLDVIAVDDGEPADSGARQGRGVKAAQGAAADHHRVRPQQRLLALVADARETGSAASNDARSEASIGSDGNKVAMKHLRYHEFGAPPPRLCRFGRLCAFAAAPLVLTAQYAGISRASGSPPSSSSRAEQPLDLAEINQHPAAQEGQPLRLADVRASIERLFATGRYADIQVDAEPYQDGVVVRFVTKNSWFIGHVVGDRQRSPTRPARRSLKTRHSSIWGSPTREANLNAALSRPEATAGIAMACSAATSSRSSIGTTTISRCNIRFEVDSGPRARFTEPTIDGNLQIDRASLLRATEFQRWLIHTWKPMTQTRLRAAIEGVRSLYAKDHRLEAKVTLEDVKYDAGDQSRRAGVPG